MRPIRFWLVALIGLLSAVGGAQQSSFPRFILSEGKIQDDTPVSGAKLCLLEKRNICYQMPPHEMPGSGNLIYQFGLDPRSERLSLADGGSWVFFSATFSGGGSGTLERIAVLRYEGAAATEKIVNLLPFVGATNVSERAMWTVGSASPYPILVHADFIWEEGEPHFGPHFYTVEAWRFDPKSDHYLKAFSYRTTKKYGSEDDKPAHILASERQEIVRRLEAP